VHCVSLLASFFFSDCSKGLGFGGTGKKSFNRRFDPYGEPFGRDDVIGCLLDLDAGEILFSKNGITGRWFIDILNFFHLLTIIFFFLEMIYRSHFIHHDIHIMTCVMHDVCDL
jgi:hypothetical protein